MKNLGLYIHIPFCVSKCGYCDFNSYSGKHHLFDGYINALKKEFRNRTASDPNLSFHSIYFGGGTPTLLDASPLAELVDFFVNRTRMCGDGEVTMEANPGTVDLKKLKGLRRSGVNRLSLGVQSFDNTTLRKLGRAHNSSDIGNAIRDARSAGFDNLSLDLIFGLPGQSVAAWEKELKTAFAYSPEHISAYQLTIEPGTEFSNRLKSGAFVLPSESTVVKMHEVTPSMMSKQGYERYEISNYARNGRVCLHNLNTWDHGEYIGVGAGACSFLNAIRTRNAANISDYMNRIEEKQSATVEEERVNGQKKILEILMLGLRTSKGVDLDTFEKKISKKITDLYPDRISEMESLGLMQITKNRMALTEKGMLLSNEVFVKLM